MADVLLVDDDADLIQSLARVLSPRIAPRSLVAAGSASKALSIAERERPLVAVIDLCLDEKVGVDSGFQLLSALQALDASMRILVLTGHGSTTHGVRAMQLGAASFIEKPADPEHLAVLIKDAAIQAELRREYQSLARQAGGSLAGELFGSSPAAERLREQIEFAAATNQPVLLLGETGTGKSLCARLIHEQGSRRHKKFIHYHPNFGGGDIVQSELFGHVKGAFTGAAESRKGLVLEADEGTLFIDEVDEVPAETQVRLLDLIQERRVRPIGSDHLHTVNTRFIAATNRSIDEALASGKIRRDLHHRIAHCVINLPPLRERVEDVEVLARGFLKRARERESLQVFDVAPAATAVLARHSWPGNVRELQAVVEGAAYRAQYRQRSVIQPDDIQIAGTLRVQDSAVGGDGSFHDQLEAFKRKLIEDALRRCEGNQVHAARMLGIDRGTIRRLVGAS